MVIYEVNLEVNHAIFNDYYRWLIEHIKEILKFTGFQKAEVGLIEHHEEDGKKKIRVSYIIDCYDSLQMYLTQHAPRMRADAVNKFGDKLSITRRIIKDIIVVDA